MIDAIDLFAGGGGFTEAARLAGVRVKWAANHAPLAVKYHAANHPEVVHECQDLHQFDFRLAPRHGLLIASPSCRGRSQAASSVGKGNRGRDAMHDGDRATAFAVVTCAEVHRPRLAIVENVLELRTWDLFEPWLACWEAMGYHVHQLALDAADFGVPQNRTRLFLVMARRDLPGLHNAIDRHRVRGHVPASSFVDVDGGTGWALVSANTVNVQGRVAKARARGLRGPFLTQHVTGHPGRGLDRPIGTLTTKHQWAIVRPTRRGDEMRMLGGREHALAHGFRPEYQIPDEVTHAVRLVGNAVPPMLGRAVILGALEAAAA